MAGNQVTLTIAGDASSATRALEQTSAAAESTAREMDQVGASAREMASQVGSSEDAFDGLVRNSGGAAEALDRASGASSALAGGLGDVGGALAEIGGEDSQLAAIGEGMEKAGTIVQGFTGLMDLAKLATMGSTAAQWLLNAAMSANPIGLIIIAIIALVAGFVLLWNKCEGFRNFWIAVWDAIKAAAKAVADWFMDTLWPTIKSLWDKVVGYVQFVVDMYKKAFQMIVDAGKWLWEKLGDVVNKIRDVFSKVKDFITAPFKAAFNFVADAWNNTIGKLSWTVPGWVPGVGGKSISAPRLPKFHDGGVVPGAPGSEMLAVLQAGETVTPAGQSPRTTIEIRSGGTQFDDALVEILAGAIRRAGGVDVVFGGSDA